MSNRRKEGEHRGRLIGAEPILLAGSTGRLAAQKGAQAASLEIDRRPWAAVCPEPVSASSVSRHVDAHIRRRLRGGLGAVEHLKDVNHGARLPKDLSAELAHQEEALVGVECG